jgi:hypothetical protein
MKILDILADTSNDWSSVAILVAYFAFVGFVIWIAKK